MQRLMAIRMLSSLVSNCLTTLVACSYGGGSRSGDRELFDLQDRIDLRHEMYWPCHISTQVPILQKRTVLTLDSSPLACSYDHCDHMVHSWRSICSWLSLFFPQQRKFTQNVVVGSSWRPNHQLDAGPEDLWASFTSVVQINTVSSMMEGTIPRYIIKHHLKN